MMAARLSQIDYSREMALVATSLNSTSEILAVARLIGDPDNEQVYGDPRKLGRTSAGLHIFVDDNQALLDRAVRAGATQVQPPTNMFYGANSASLQDPFGHVWVLLSWKEDIDPGEIQRRGDELMSAS